VVFIETSFFTRWVRELMADELVVIVGIWGATRRTTPRFAERAASATGALSTPEE